MATVTQSIPALIGGISQQPDELKVPGQVNAAKNVLPDVTHGLLKRPGSQLIASLSDDTNPAYNYNSVDGGKWFHYYRDDDEQYIGQINTSTGAVNMWRCSDGQIFPVNSANKPIKDVQITGVGSGYTSAPTVTFVGGGGVGALATAVVRGGQISEINITNAGSGYTSAPNVVFSGGGGSNAAATCTVSTVTHALLTSYLSHGSPQPEDLQTLTVNDYTFITNRKKTTAMSDTIEPVRPPEAYIELKQIKYASQYALNLYDSNQTRDVTTATRIKVDRLYDSSNTCGHNDEGRLFFKHLFDQRKFTYNNNDYVWGVQCGSKSGTDDSGATVNGIKMSDSTCPSTKTGLFSSVGSGTTYKDRNDPDPPPVYEQDTKYRRGDIIQANNKVYWLNNQTRSVGNETAPSHSDTSEPNNWVYLNTLSAYQAGQVEQHTVRVFSKSHMDNNYAVKTVDNTNNVVSSVVNAAVSGRENMYFRITTTGQAVPYGEGSNVRYYARYTTCLLYTSPSPRDRTRSRMPSSA